MYIDITSKSHYFLGITVEDLYENFERPKIKVGAEWVTKGQNTSQVKYFHTNVTLHLDKMLTK